VLPATAHIEVRSVIDPADVVVTFDGQFGVQLPPNGRVRVSRASRTIRLLHTSPRTHFDMLREKLKWGH
jgi:NAD+ kinase